MMVVCDPHPEISYVLSAPLKTIEHGAANNHAIPLGNQGQSRSTSTFNKLFYVVD